MAAGLGFKTFNTGDVLSAADTNGYLMQGVLVFASAAARDSAITSPQEGQFAYLKDTNVTTYYTGSAWANLDTTGMTNPMTTTGDTIYSSSGSTPARLGIGTTGQVLTVAGGVPSWATPAAGGGGKVLQVVQATYATELDVTSTTYTDSGLTASITPSSATSKVLIIVSQACQVFRSSATQARGAINLMRGATEIVFKAGDSMSVEGATATVGYAGSQSFSYLDSPATTSATTYKTQQKAGVSGPTIRTQGNGSLSTILLLEIGA
jgi:hypothetical protein